MSANEKWQTAIEERLRSAARILRRIGQPGPWWRRIAMALFLVAALAMSVHCYRNSMFDIDLLGYAGSVAFLDTGDIVAGHSLVYREPLTPHLRGLDDNGKQAMDMRRRAADPYYAAVFLPYFAIKPLYVSMMQLAHKAGLSVIDSSRAVSTFFYFGIAVMLWLYTGSPLALIVLVFPEVMLVGQANEPDGMSCFFLLLGLWLVFIKNRDMGLLVLVLSVWVRPENMLLCLLAFLVLFVQRRLDLAKAAVLAVLCVGSDMLINHFGYPWRELYSHMLGNQPGTGTTFELSQYFSSLAHGVRDMLHGAAPLFGLLWVVCFPLVQRGLRLIMALTLLFSIGRFLIFPPYEPRYYPLFFVVTSIAAVVVATEALWRKWFSHSSL